MRARVSAALALAIAGCAAPPAPLQPARGATFYAYTLLGEEGAIVARVITSAPGCPAIEIDGVARAMQVRAPSGTVPLRTTTSAPELSKPSAFPVLTCEAAIPAGAARAAVGGHALPLPKAAPRRIVVIGDTGCRLKASDGVYQACGDPAQWPFEQVAESAAASAPDLVIHVGDYHYRENACPPGHAGCAGSPWGYGWDAWNADFFAPAAKLLAAAPWIVVRGNHESCARGGQGWWRFLDPRPLAKGRDCDDPADDSTGDYSEPYAVPIGPASDTRFVVFDSSLVGLAPLAQTDATYRIYRAQLERAFGLGAKSPHAFFVNHHPVLAFAPKPSDPAAPYPGNAGLQSVLRGIEPAALFPANVSALIAGHFHLMEILSFSTPHPPQIVSGNGGDWVDATLAIPLPAGTAPAPGAVVASIVATNRFGFMTMDRDGPRWRLTARDATGGPMTTCTLFERRADCAPTGWR
jgi:hypothetical protein